MNIKYMVLLVFILFFNSVYTSAQCNQEDFTGEGTYYGYTGGGNCSYPHPYRIKHTGALNAAQYKGAILCGACAKVTGELGTIYLSLEDQCPECKYGDIDLAEEAFPLIAPKIKGRVPISWSIVSCPLEGPVQFYFKEGSSLYWTAVQIRNHKNPVSKLEYYTAGQYKFMTRTSYNYFEVQQGMGPGPYNFRITDYYGNTITENNISLVVTTPIPGKNQFPDCNPVSALLNQQKDGLGKIEFTESSGKMTVTNKDEMIVDIRVLNILGESIKSEVIPPNAEINIFLPANTFFLVQVHKGADYFVKKIYTF